MSLRSEPIPVVPAETVRIARAAFPKGNLYLKMRDELGTFYEDSDFADLFPKRGQPGLAVATCNHKRSKLQSSEFWNQINCNYK